MRISAMVLTGVLLMSAVGQLGQPGAAPAVAGVYEAPLDVRAAPKDGELPLVKFVAPPKAESAGEKVKITFTVSAATDVEVAIVDGKGAVVRHLAAGLLGKGAPEPFKKDSLAQEILWDRKDDAAQPARGDLKVRVSVGARPKLDKYVGWDGNTLGAIAGLAVGKDGEVFVLSSEFFRGGTDVRVLDRTGKYLRTIVPYDAKTPKERAASVGQLEVEGERLPIIFHGLGRTTYPLMNGMRQQTMAMHPKGYMVMISALGTMAEQGPPRYLLALSPQGGSPEGVEFVGPRMRPGGSGMIGGAGESTAGCFDHVALSPDGEWAYVSVGPTSRLGPGKRNGVLRMKWSDKEATALWLGKPEAGADDEHLGQPEGLSTDAKGNLYVCDWGNNRVMIFSADGKVVGKFAVDKPQQIAVHPASGEIYVLSVGAAPRWGRLWADDGVIRKFSARDKGEPKELAKVDVKGASLVMALDPSASPAMLWVACNGLCPVVDKGGQLELGKPVSNTNGLLTATYLAADPARDRVYLYLNDEKVTQLDLNSGKRSTFCKGTDMALDREGNVYVLGGRDNAIYRYDPAGRALPFSALGSNKIMTKGYRGYGPNFGFGGIVVGATGDIYLVRNSNYGGPDSYGGRVDVFGPDGKSKKESLIEGLGYGDCGLGVDAAGNIYVGSNLKPADKPFPEPFMGKVPAKGWVWWKGPDRDVPWRYTYYNSYLWHWGAVFKFGPNGGTFYGQNGGVGITKDPKYGQPKPADLVANAPADATSYRSAYLGYEVKVTGAQWRYAGCGIIPSSGDGLTPDPGCVCFTSQLAVDGYGRVFAPNVFRFSVEMLDSNGNQIARIGRYANADTAGPDIGFAWPGYVSVAGGKVFVSDAVNRRVVVVGFDHAAEATCDVK